MSYIITANDNFIENMANEISRSLQNQILSEHSGIGSIVAEAALNTICGSWQKSTLMGIIKSSLDIAIKLDEEYHNTRNIMETAKYLTNKFSIAHNLASIINDGNISISGDAQAVRSYFELIDVCLEKSISRIGE